MTWWLLFSLVWSNLHVYMEIDFQFPKLTSRVNKGEVEGGGDSTSNVILERCGLDLSLSYFLFIINLETSLVQ